MPNFYVWKKNEGTLFYFLSNRDRNIAVRRKSKYSRIETARIYIYRQTGKNIIKYYLN